MKHDTLHVSALGPTRYRDGLALMDALVAARARGPAEGGCETGDWLLYPDHEPVLTGVEVDWIETLQATGFAIRNPNAVRSCGCGKSFETH